MGSVPVRLTAFAAALLVVFGLAFGVGRATASDDGNRSQDLMTDDGADHGGGFGGDDHEMGEDG